MILVRIEGVEGNCQIRGYEKFFIVDSLDLGAESELDNKGSSDDRGNSMRDFVVKKDREPEEVSFSRKADILTPTLMGMVIKNRTSAQKIFSTIDACWVQLRADTGGANTDIKAFLLLRFGNARLTSWKLSSGEYDHPNETVDFKYTQIAMQYRATEAGPVYRPSTTETWNFEKNAPWTEPPEWRK